MVKPFLRLAIGCVSVPFLLCFGTAFAQVITEEDVAKAITEQLAKIPGYCIAILDQGGSEVIETNFKGVKRLMLDKGLAINDPKGRVVLNEVGKKHVQKNAWGNPSGDLYDCIAIGKPSLLKVMVFKDPVFGESSVTYSVSVANVPEFVSTKPNCVTQEQISLVRANERWMTKLMYVRLQSGIN